MAKRLTNPFTDFDGQLGGVVFYHYRGKPCMRRAPVRTKQSTPAEIKNQFRFKLASKYARAALADPASATRYVKAAQKTGRSAQNLAVSDYMLSPKLAEIDLSGYAGRTGERIKIVAVERDVGAAEVTVVIGDRTKAVLEQGAAVVDPDAVTWWYAAKLNLPPDQPLWITITAVDQARNATSRQLHHTTGG
jgi:hypothetical protein